MISSIFSQFHMIAGLEIELGDLPPAPYLHILRVILALGDLLVRRIGTRSMRELNSSCTP